MNRNLKLIVNNKFEKIEKKYFFERNELKIILDLYAKMVSEGSWKDYGLNISSKQVEFSVVYLKMQLKMLYIRFVKILSQRIKILNI